ncbi:MAG: oxygenase MpaB family protein [Gaiellaceae bacterium]
MRTHAERVAATDGYFEPESMVRRLGNSPVTPFLGGGTAVLLQVAHPLVAAGVVAHSGYNHDLWRRLVRTLRALYLITFGDKEEAEQAGAAVQAAHDRVRGTTREQLGPFPAGTDYSASDPELMLWVHATLVYASLAAYERFVSRLSEREHKRYVVEMNLVARLFGVPAHVLPSTYSAFHEYFRSQLASEVITVTAPAREVASVILTTPMPAPMRLLVPAHRLATARLLPPRLRDEYGLRWSGARELVLPLAGGAVRYGTAPALRIAAHLHPPRRVLAGLA